MSSHDYHSRDRHRNRSRSRSRDRNNSSVPSTDKNGMRSESRQKNTLPATKKREPLSLEELMRRKQAEREAEAKPVFLTKEQRQQLALQRRQEEVAAQRGNGHQKPTQKSDYRSSSRVENGHYYDRQKQKELDFIKKQYLGTDVAQAAKRPSKVSEKAKFKFEWDASEDTSQSLATADAPLLFGRGFRAGIDRREQKRVAANVESDILRRQKKANGGTQKHVDVYEGNDMKVDIHWSEKSREAMTERDWRIFREDHNMSFKGANTVLPFRTWEEAQFPSSIMKAIRSVGYAKPSPIQMAAIPLGMQQRDVIGIAETGSGKTAAFVLPMLVYLMKQPPMKGNPDVEAEGPYAVILAPTRELTQQIEEETRKLAAHTDFRVVSVVGGQPIEDQGFALRKGCEIVVATPGRLNDCIDRSYAVLNQCNYVVLDEADRMIEIGFEAQVTQVLDAMPSSNLRPENEAEEEANRVYRTTYMFSATMPPAVERLAKKYLRRPVVVNIGTLGRAAENVSQRIMWVKENEKPAALQQELEQLNADARVIVFVNTKRNCDIVANHLAAMDYRATLLHGGKTQDQREESIKGFREDKYNVLVATDVAGRGIDVPNVAMVVNYDMPGTIDAYTHRIGRTARAGRKGAAVTLLTPGDSEVFYDLRKFLEDSKAHVPRELAAHEASRIKPASAGGGNRNANILV